MYCNICGDVDCELTVRRYWDCDDGWTIGKLCSYCWDDIKDCKPDPEDFAFEKAGEYYTESQPLDMEDLEELLFV